MILKLKLTAIRLKRKKKLNDKIFLWRNIPVINVNREEEKKNRRFTWEKKKHLQIIQN